MCYQNVIGEFCIYGEKCRSEILKIRVSFDENKISFILIGLVNVKKKIGLNGERQFVPPEVILSNNFITTEITQTARPFLLYGKKALDYKTIHLFGMTVMEGF